jgi:hypothetical protein
MKQLEASYKMLSVTYISVDSIQEGVGSSQILPLVKLLAVSGYCVSLVTCEKTHPTLELRREVSEYGINWVILKYGRNGFLGGLGRLARLTQRIPSGEVLHARSDIPAVAAAIRYPKARILWDVRSLWADQRRVIDSKGWNLVTFRMALLLEYIAARRSVGIVTLTHSVVPILESRHKKLPVFRDVIPTCTQLDRFLPSPMPQGELTCLLAGTFNDFYDLSLTKRILHELSNLCTLKVVWARPNESGTTALNVGETKVMSVPYFAMPDVIQDSHFGLVVCKSENLDALSAVAPTKVAEFLASGRPILVSKGIGDLDSIIEKYKVGVVLEPDYKESSLLEFIALLNDPEIHVRCRKSAEELFSMDEAFVKYTNLYQNISNHE